MQGTRFARGFTLRLPLASLPDSHFARRIFFRSRREPVRRLGMWGLLGRTQSTSMSQATNPSPTTD